MNRETIEHLLQKAPPVQPPGDLRAKLKRDVALPQVALSENVHHATGSHSWIRRWLPATAFAAWFVGCVVVFGYQASRINELARQQASAQEQFAASRQQAVIVEQPSAPTVLNQPEQTDETRTQLERLRAEVTQLRQDVAEMEALRAENSRLRAELKAQVPATTVKPEDEFFAVQQEKAARAKCVNNLKQLMLAAHMQAQDTRADVLTKDTSTLLPYLSKDGQQSSCVDGKTRYQIMSPGASMKDPWIIFARCPIHNNVALVDGSVHQLSANQKMVDTGNGIRLE